MPTKLLEAQVRHHQPRVAVIELHGEINSFAEAALTAAYAEAEAMSPESILLNFSGVDYINSTGIALIVTLLAKARKAHIHLLTCGLSEHYIEIFNRGKTQFKYTAIADKPWIKISSGSGTIDKQTRLMIGIDWKNKSSGNDSGSVRITGTNTEVVIGVKALNPEEVSRNSLEGFVEGQGVVSIEAEHYTNKTDAGAGRWIKIAHYGHTLSGMRATSPADAPATSPGKDSPSLEYKMYLFTAGEVGVEGTFGPTLNFIHDRPLRYAMSFDDETPQVVTLVPADYNAQNGNRDWELSVMNNGRRSSTTHMISKPGYHTLKVRMIDPGVVLEKIVVTCPKDSTSGGVRPSYLGPPESYHHRNYESPNSRH